MDLLCIFPTSIGNRFNFLMARHIPIKKKEQSLPIKSFPPVTDGRTKPLRICCNLRQCVLLLWSPPSAKQKDCTLLNNLKSKTGVSVLHTGWILEASKTALTLKPSTRIVLGGNFDLRFQFEFFSQKKNN